MPLQSIARIESLLKRTGGVVVSLDGSSTWGHLESFAEKLDDDLGYGNRILLTLPTGALPTLALNKRPIVDSTTYIARQIVPIEDGGISQVLLAEVSA